MPPWGPIDRRVLIKALRSAGFQGPFSGGKHQFMLRGDLTLRIPNPHQPPSASPSSPASSAKRAFPARNGKG